MAIHWCFSSSTSTPCLRIGFQIWLVGSIADSSILDLNRKQKDEWQQQNKERKEEEIVQAKTGWLIPTEVLPKSLSPGPRTCAVSQLSSQPVDFFAGCSRVPAKKALMDCCPRCSSGSLLLFIIIPDTSPFDRSFGLEQWRCCCQSSTNIERLEDFGFARLTAACYMCRLHFVVSRPRR